MNVSINQLVKSLLHKESLEHCSLPELTAYAERNPYFGAAQLLLAKKFQTELPEKFEEQYQKTLLYFHNPLWVEHLLNETGTAVVEVEKVEKAYQLETIKNDDKVERVDEVERVEGNDKVMEAELLPTPVTVSAESEIPVIPTPVPVEAVNPANDLVFEPYHMVDYFASQGIRFKEEEKPTDELGKQLKSFTDWLKTLKRLPVSDMANAVSPQAERKVELLAGQSITDRDVFTEAMAEVWEKQGNALKAIEIYTKLSLLEPAKSPYFAAKIEGLKKNN